MNFRKIKKMISLYVENEFEPNKKKILLEDYLNKQQYEYTFQYVHNEDWQEHSYSIKDKNYIYNLIFPNKSFNFCTLIIKDKDDVCLGINIPYNNKGNFNIILVKNFKQKIEVLFEINIEELNSYVKNKDIFLEKIEFERITTDKEIPDISKIIEDNKYLLEDFCKFINSNQNNQSYKLLKSLKKYKNII